MLMDIALVPLNIETALAACRGDPDLARALVEQYRASLPEERTALARAVSAAPPDWADVGRRAHRLQSGGAYLGIERVAAAAGALETDVLAGAAPDELTAASRALDRAIDEFLAVPDDEWAGRLRGGAGGC
jgi:HPt (histidine-containing phosphotransfer) domain-containing protein